MKTNIKSVLDRGEKLDNLEARTGKEMQRIIMKFYLLVIQKLWTTMLDNFNMVLNKLKINFGGKMLK